LHHGVAVTNRWAKHFYEPSGPGPLGNNKLQRTAGIGALQSVADDVAYGAPHPGLRFVEDQQYAALDAFLL